jgi:hypothetical protein
MRSFYLVSNNIGGLSLISFGMINYSPHIGLFLKTIYNRLVKRHESDTRSQKPGFTTCHGSCINNNLTNNYVCVNFKSSKDIESGKQSTQRKRIIDLDKYTNNFTYPNSLSMKENNYVMDDTPCNDCQLRIDAASFKIYLSEFPLLVDNSTRYFGDFIAQ